MHKRSKLKRSVGVRKKARYEPRRSPWVFNETLKSLMAYAAPGGKSRRELEARRSRRRRQREYAAAIKAQEEEYRASGREHRYVSYEECMRQKRHMERMRELRGKVQREVLAAKGKLGGNKQGKPRQELLC